MGKKFKLKIFTTSIVFLLVLSIVYSFFIIEESRAEGNSIYVDVSYFFGDNDGSADKPYRTIQQAINVANNEDSIFVFEGIYNETIIIDKSISLIGLDKERTVISKNGLSHRNLIEINADYVTLENFTISDDNDQNLVALVYINSDHVSIHGNKIMNSSTWGLYFDSSNDNTFGNNFINNTKGIHLFSSHNNVFSNNIFNDCKESVIQLYSSDNNIVYNNNMNNSKYTIRAQSSSNNRIERNIINDSDIDGIKLSAGNNNTIRNNTVDNSGGNGVFLTSSNSKIIGNELDNSQQGINLGSTNCRIYNNFVNNSRVWGIYTSPSTKNNIIYLNHFLNNNANAKAYGDNQWYYNGSGNYWDDYKEVDINLDKIGDIPYSKQGVNDIYPLGYFLIPPEKPDDPSPLDGAENVGLSITFSVNVNDNDSDLLDVYFYRASDDKLYGIAYDIQSGQVASYHYNMPFETTVLWYAVVTDGRLESRSDIWIFTTKEIPPSNQHPIANPGGPYTSYLGEETTFDGSKSFDSDGVIDFYRWSFGDGSSQILSTAPQHCYSNPGTYTITLTVVDNDGQSNTETTTITVSPIIHSNFYPEAAIDVISSADIYEEIIFDGSASVDTDGIILNYSWDFGDSFVGYGRSVSHNYSQNGTYTIFLTVTDDDNNTDVLSTTLEIGSSISELEENTNDSIDFLVLIISVIIIVAGIVVVILFWRNRQEYEED